MSVTIFPSKGRGLTGPVKAAEALRAEKKKLEDVKKSGVTDPLKAAEAPQAEKRKFEDIGSGAEAISVQIEAVVEPKSLIAEGKAAIAGATEAPRSEKRKFEDIGSGAEALSVQIEAVVEPKPLIAEGKAAIAGHEESEAGPITGLSWEDVFGGSTTDFRRRPKRRRIVEAVYNPHSQDEELTAPMESSRDDKERLRIELDSDTRDGIFVNGEGLFVEERMMAFLVYIGGISGLEEDPITGQFTKLDLSRMELTSEQIEQLIWALGKGLPITSLNLSFCSLVQPRINELLEAANQGGYLEFLYLEECGIDDTGAISLARVLPSCLNLKGFDLSGNKFTSEGANSLVEAMEKRNLGGWLRIKRNNISDEVNARLEAFYLKSKMNTTVLQEISLNM